MPVRKPALHFLLISAVLGFLVLLVFWPVAHHDFIGFDDPQYITKNPHVVSGLTWQNVRWAFTSNYASNWHPLTWLSHMLDVQLFGVTSGPPHLVNVVLHALNTVLVFAVFRQLTGAAWRSAFVAALFGAHPAHVESVAWLAERKDVLSTLFGLLAMLFYALYCSRRRVTNTCSSGRESALIQPGSLHSRGLMSAAIAGSSWRWHALALVSFAFSLMSKPMLVTLPFVLLLLDLWPLKRLIWSSEQRFLLPIRHSSFVIFEKLPFLLLSIISSVLTYWAQSTGGSVETLERVPLGSRLANAVIGYALYLKHLIWPADLAILYLRPAHWPLWALSVSLLIVAAVTYLAVCCFRSRPYVAVGWFWFLGTLLPVIGLVQVGNQLIADRYTYFPYLGLLLAVVWGASDLGAKLRLSKQAAAMGCVAILANSAVAAHQVHFWRDTETLFNHCLAVTGENFVAHNILAASLDPKTRFHDAKAHFEAALRIQPGYVDAQRNLGVLLTDHGDYEGALTYLDKAVGSHPELGSIYAKLALLLDDAGRTGPAIVYYRRALSQYPSSLQCLNNLAWLLATSSAPALRSGSDAVTFAKRACELTQNQQAPLLGTLAAAYAEAGDFPSAITTAEKAAAVAEANGEPNVAARNRELLDLYKAGKPFHGSR